MRAIVVSHDTWERFKEHVLRTLNFACAAPLHRRHLALDYLNTLFDRLEVQPMVPAQGAAQVVGTKEEKTHV